MDDSQSSFLSSVQVGVRMLQADLMKRWKETGNEEFKDRYWLLAEASKKIHNAVRGL